MGGVETSWRVLCWLFYRDDLSLTDRHVRRVQIKKLNLTTSAKNIQINKEVSIRLPVVVDKFSVVVSSFSSHSSSKPMLTSSKAMSNPPPRVPSITIWEAKKSIHWVSFHRSLQFLMCIKPGSTPAAVGRYEGRYFTSKHDPVKYDSVWCTYVCRYNIIQQQL